jgi:peptide/nickel transport system substrate-binding protein
MKRFVAFALIAVAIATTFVSAASKRGGKMTYGRYADSLFLDPVLNDANVDIWILLNIYDTLLQPTNDGKGTKPGLATRYKVSSDGKTFTLTLRSGVKFSDGSSFSAGDVKFSLDRAKNPENGAWNGLIASIDTVTITNPTTVTLALKYPDPSLPAALATFNTAILPQKQFMASPGAKDEDKAKVFAEKPIGTGPFMLTDWKKGSSMTLKRNPNYWAKGDDGAALPYLDEINFQIIPDDNTRILKLQSGELDGAEFIPLARVAELQKDPKLNMQLFPSTEVDSVIMNNRPKLKDGSDNPLSNVKVRQALNYATDKDAIIKLVTFGLAKPSKSFMSSATPLFAAQHGYVYNLEKAKTLLKQAGFDKGLEVSTMIVSGNADQTAIASALQQMWSQVGVKLRIDQLDSASNRAKYRANDFMMRVSKWTDDIADPSEITGYFAIYKNVESLHTGFQNDQLEGIFEQSQREPNRAKRASLYRSIQKIYFDAAPIIFLYEAPYPVALQKYVKGFVQIPLGNNIFVNTSLEK